LSPAWIVRRTNREEIMVNANVTATVGADSSALNAIRAMSNAELDQVSGGWFPFVAAGVALGILYCWADGDFDSPPPPQGDFPTGPKNVG
jgi:lactobin A/cerein 7B family class IIb bacteriocin